MEMKFENILNIYLLRLENLRLRKAKKLISDDYFEGSISMNFFWFQEMKDLCKEDNLQYGVIRRKNDIAPEEKKKFDTQKDFPLIYMLDYRGVSVPVYADDYGQQDFAIFNGEEISGGSYNFYPEIEFTYRIDKKLEEQFLAESPSQEDTEKKQFFSEMIDEKESK